MRTHTRVERRPTRHRVSPLARSVPRSFLTQNPCLAGPCRRVASPCVLVGRPRAWLRQQRRKGSSRQCWAPQTGCPPPTRRSTGGTGHSRTPGYRRVMKPAARVPGAQPADHARLVAPSSLSPPCRTISTTHSRLPTASSPSSRWCVTVTSCPLLPAVCKGADNQPYGRPCLGPHLTHLLRLTTTRSSWAASSTGCRSTGGRRRRCSTC